MKKCEICGKDFQKPRDVSTILNRWKGFGKIPEWAIVHPWCDKKRKKK